jgi:hypothetical protein
MEWISTKDRLPPNGLVVHAMLGTRRIVTDLKRLNNLWFLPDGSMYVYYTPTHWMTIELPKQ